MTNCLLSTNQQQQQSKWPVKHWTDRWKQHSLSLSRSRQVKNNLRTFSYPHMYINIYIHTLYILFFCCVACVASENVAFVSVSLVYHFAQYCCCCCCSSCCCCCKCALSLFCWLDADNDVAGIGVDKLACRSVRNCRCCIAIMSPLKQREVTSPA